MTLYGIFWISLPITIALSPLYTHTVAVAYSRTNGTTTAGEDYIAIGGTRVFTPGLTCHSFVMSILDDEIAKGDEMVLIALFVIMHPNMYLLMHPLPPILWHHTIDS